MASYQVMATQGFDDMRSYSFFPAAVVALTIFAGTIVPRGAVADVRVAGSTTVAASVLQPFENRIVQLAGVRYEMQAIGSGRGIIALVKGAADIAAISAPLNDVVENINAKRPGTVDGRGLVAHKIGVAKVAFIVHPSNTVKQMTAQQITDILAGRIKFWSEVGGISMPIEVVTQNKGGGVRSVVEQKIGEAGDKLVTPTEVQTGLQVVFAVSQLPTALGITASAAANNSVFVLATEQPIEQPMFLVTRGQPSRQILKFIQAARSVAGGEAGSPGRDSGSPGRDSGSPGS